VFTDNSTSAQENTISKKEALPWGSLLALAMAGFICILTETLPAGLLPQISNDLGVSQALAGQLVTIYAIGSLLAAIPLTTATRGWNRRPLLLLCMIGFLLFNTITAISSIYVLTLIARFFAGVAAGILWGMTAGYARRMVPESLTGKAIAVAMVGTPLALALGVPLGTFFANYANWQIIFGVVSLLTIVLIAWILWKMPDFEGESVQARLSLRTIFFIPGIRSILFVVFSWVLAHNILYTYIAPFLSETVLAERVDLILLIFGVTSVIGIWIIGLLIDRYLRLLVLISIGIFALASTALGIWGNQPEVIIFSVVAWGLTFGGAATLLQTSIALVGGKQADIAQSMLVTTWNLGISTGGLVGGILLDGVGARYLPLALVPLLCITFYVVWQAKQYAFSK